MTNSGKVRIYELSRDLDLASRRILDAAEQCSIPVKSHSSSISQEDAETIKHYLVTEGHLGNVKPAQKGKATASRKSGKAQPASKRKETKGASKTPTARSKAKLAATARPKPARAATAKKPTLASAPSAETVESKPATRGHGAAQPSLAGLTSHQRPSHTTSQPSSGDPKSGTATAVKKSPRRPSVVRVQTGSRSAPGKTAAKGDGGRKSDKAKAAPVVLQTVPIAPKPTQKPKPVRPTAVKPVAPKPGSVAGKTMAPKPGATPGKTAAKGDGGRKSDKAKAAPVVLRSTSVDKPLQTPGLPTKQANGSSPSAATTEQGHKAPRPAAAKQPPQLMAPPKSAALKSPVTPKPIRKPVGRTSSPSTIAAGTPRAPKDQHSRSSSTSTTATPAKAPQAVRPPGSSSPTQPPQAAKTAEPPTRRPIRATPARSVVASGMPRSRSSTLVGRPETSRSTQPTPQAEPPVRRPQIVARRPNARVGISQQPTGVGAPPEQSRPESVGRLQQSGGASGKAPVRISTPPGKRRSKPSESPSPELVGRPQRRSPGGPPGISRPGGTGSEGPQGLPPGVRRPPAPGELLDKPASGGSPGTVLRPKPEPKTTAQGPTPPRRPGLPRSGAPGRFRPGAGGRPRRPEWDDSARLEQLRRGGWASKQRTKVHIIGDNDDDVNAGEGFASEGAAAVLSASLARPSIKPQVGPEQPGGAKAKKRKRPKETARQRQRRRAMELRQAREAKQQRPEMLVVPEGNLTVQELAEALSVDSSDIIKSLFFKGISATVTQSLDLPAIEKVAEEFGVPVVEDDVEAAAKKTVAMIEDEDLGSLIQRPPVVTVMGHVDHGKTSLLDAIRSTRVAAGEAGGITQHIGAYQVEVDQNDMFSLITFLDTPGHEAFTAMRARGTKVTDIAVLVVAADDGVRPQTIEAISHARAAKVPIVVAINKIDKEGANPDRVRQELAEHGLVGEEWGGDTVMVPVSALKDQNIDRLLEMILLVSEVEDLQANPERLARGTVVEAHLDRTKGPVATLLIQNGTLRPGDVIAAGPVLGKIRAMVNDRGERVMEALPSAAVEALGFSEVPTAGDAFEVFEDEKAARSVVSDRVSNARTARLAQQMASRRVSLTALSDQAAEGELKELNIILKTDVQGSLEAILGSLEQLSQEEVQIRVLLSSPGEITETDIDLASASGAVVIGFNTSMASGARRAAEAASVDVRNYDVIYKLLEDIEGAMEGLLEPELVEEPLGWAEVRVVFSIGNGAVAGCYVTEGKLQRNCRLRVHRGKQLLHEGDLDSLRRLKDNVKEVNSGYECGVGLDHFMDWKEGDRLEAFSMVMVRRKLNG